MLEKDPSKLLLLMVYAPCTSTNRPAVPAHCCIHSQISIATGPSCSPKTLASIPESSWFTDAAVGAFGSATALGASRKLLHPDTAAKIPNPAAAYRMCRCIG